MPGDTPDTNDVYDQDAQDLQEQNSQDVQPEITSKCDKSTEYRDGIEVDIFQGLCFITRPHLTAPVEYRLAVQGEAEAFRVDGNLQIHIDGRVSRLHFQTQCQYGNEDCDIDSYDLSTNNGEEHPMKYLNSIYIDNLGNSPIKVLLQGDIKIETDFPDQDQVFRLKNHPRSGSFSFLNEKNEEIIRIEGATSGLLDALNFRYLPDLVESGDYEVIPDVDMDASNTGSDADFLDTTAHTSSPSDLPGGCGCQIYLTPTASGSYIYIAALLAFIHRMYPQLIDSAKILPKMMTESFNKKTKKESDTEK